MPKKLLKKLDKYNLVEPLIFFAITASLVFGLGFYKIGGLNSLNSVTGMLGFSANDFKITIITDANCEDCTDIFYFVDNLLNDTNLNINSVDILDYKTENASRLIEKYDIKLVPTAIFSKEVAFSPLEQFLHSIASKEGDGNFVVRLLNPPYTNITTGSIIDKTMSATLITFDECTQCYDPAIHLDIINGFGLMTSEARSFDYGSEQGQDLVEKYFITQIPTIILSPETEKYLFFARNIWPAVGTIEEDGSFVFRMTKSLGNLSYFDIEKQQVMEN